MKRILQTISALFVLLFILVVLKPVKAVRTELSINNLDTPASQSEEMFWVFNDKG